MKKNPEPVRLIRIITRLNVGGPSLQACLLTNEMDRRGYQTLLVDGRLRQGEDDMSYLLSEENGRREHLDCLVNEVSPLKDFRALVKLYKLARKFRPDVIHTHHAKAGALGRLAGWLAGVPVLIHTFHGHVFRGHFSAKKVACFKAAEKLLSKISSRIIAISPAQKKDLTQIFKVTPEEKTEVVRLGFDLQRFVRAEKNTGLLREKKLVDPARKQVGIIGRLVPVKNHRLFLKAAQVIISRMNRKDVGFVVIGSGELEGELKKIVREKGLEKDVVFVPTVKEIEKVFADLDAVTLCSHSEGTPVAIIEAMAAGVTVVSTSVGGVPDVIKDGETGRLVPPNNPDEMARAIIETLDLDPEKKEKQTRRARQFVLENYSAERLVNELDVLYRKCLEEI